MTLKTLVGKISAQSSNSFVYEGMNLSQIVNMLNEMDQMNFSLNDILGDLQLEISLIGDLSKTIAEIGGYQDQRFGFIEKTSPDSFHHKGFTLQEINEIVETMDSSDLSFYDLVADIYVEFKILQDMVDFIRASKSADETKKYAEIKLENEQSISDGCFEGISLETLKENIQKMKKNKLTLSDLINNKAVELQIVKDLIVLAKEKRDVDQQIFGAIAPMHEGDFSHKGFIIEELSVISNTVMDTDKVGLYEAVGDMAVESKVLEDLVNFISFAVKPRP